MRRLVPAAALLVALAPAWAACSRDDPQPRPVSETPSESESPSRSESPTASPGPETPAALDWRALDQPVATEVTVSGDWTLTVPDDARSAELTGPDRHSIEAPRDFRIADALIDGEYAVVVAEHERAERPNVATVVELATGEQRPIDGDSDVPTTTGGTWALGSGLLVHATAPGRDYCLAVVDLATGRAERGPCVPPRHGITNARITPAGITAMTFDDSRPSCRTLNRVEGAEFVPLGGVEECRGWEAVTTETAAVWGSVENERRVEQAQYYLDTGDGPVPLGPGTTGTLTWCGDAAYFVRDPQRNDQPARLMRVVPDDGEGTPVYSSPGRGNAFLAAPRCGGSQLTVSAFSAAGDEQVTATLS